MDLKDLGLFSLLLISGVGIWTPPIRQSPVLVLLLGGIGLSAFIIMIKEGKKIQEQTDSHDEIVARLDSIEEGLSKSATDIDLALLRQRVEESHPHEVREGQWIYSAEDTDRKQAEVEKALSEYNRISSKCSDLKSRVSREDINSQATAYVENTLQNAISFVERDALHSGEDPERIHEHLDLANLYLDVIELEREYSERSSTSVQLNQLLTHIENGTSEETEAIRDIVEASRGYLSVLEWNEDPPTEDAREALNRATSNPSTKTAEIAFNEVESLITLQEDAITIEKFCRGTNENRVDFDFAELRKRTQEAIETGDPQLIEGLGEEVEKVANSRWEWNDLFTYSWRKFEKLVADYFRAEGYSAQVTRSGSDRGIDVIAQGESERIAIQVKQQNPENKVGRPVVQKTAAMLAANEATEVIIITSSRFTEPAVQEAQQYNGRVGLVNGQEFVQLLSDSSIPPPD